MRYIPTARVGTVSIDMIHPDDLLFRGFKYITMILEVVRAGVGFMLVLFLPGLAATYALFPRKEEIDILERIALSIGLSISLVVLSVLALNQFLGVAINLMNSLLIILSVIFIFSLLGYWRKTRLKAEIHG